MRNGGSPALVDGLLICLSESGPLRLLRVNPKKFDEVGVRTRAIERSLRDVKELHAPVSRPAVDMAELLPLDVDAIRVEGAAVD